MRHACAAILGVALEKLKTGEIGSMPKTIIAGSLIPASLLALLVSGCMGEPTVSYSRDVKPILQKNCLTCHQEGGAGLEASGFSMATYDDLMRGTKYGPMILPGDAEGSNMIVLMEGRADPSISMPHGDLDPVSKQDIDTIRRWVQQGAKKN
jgi:mono/diheme cytochrome c family protein